MRERQAPPLGRRLASISEDVVCGSESRLSAGEMPVFSRARCFLKPSSIHCLNRLKAGLHTCEPPILPHSLGYLLFNCIDTAKGAPGGGTRAPGLQGTPGQVTEFFEL